MNRLITRADVDGGSRQLGVYASYDAAWEAVMKNGWIPKSATWRVAGAVEPGPHSDRAMGPPTFAALIVENGEEEFVLAITTLAE